MGAVLDKLRQDVRGEIPNSNNLLERAIQASRPQGIPLNATGAFMPSNLEEVQDIPRVAGSIGEDFTNIPFTDIGTRSFIDIPEPKTSFGKNIRTASDLAGLATLGAGAGRGIEKIIRNKEIGKVQDIQKAFGPWVKKYTGESGNSLGMPKPKTSYGAAFIGGIKDVIKGSTQGGSMTTLGGRLTNKGSGLVEEVKRAFNPLRRSDAYQDLPKKTMNAIEKIYARGENLKPRDVLNAANRLRKSPTHSKFDETGNLARTATKKLKDIVKKESPEFSKVDADYGEFAGTKSVMEKFRPDLKGQGKSGTAQGTRLLKNISKREPGELEAIERFGKETGINIVGPAKTASKIRAGVKTTGRLAEIGGVLWLLKKILPQQSKEVSTVLDVSQ